jgi:hypothetical protein
VELRCLAPDWIPPPDVNGQKNGVTVVQLDRQVMYLLLFTNNWQRVSFLVKGGGGGRLSRDSAVYFCGFVFYIAVFRYMAL